jgi:hypothetical protein
LTDNKNSYYYNKSTYKEMADKFCKYFMKERGQVTIHKEHTTVETIKINERECILAEGNDYDSELDALVDDMD